MRHSLIKEFVDTLQAKGRYCFTKSEISKSLKLTPASLKFGLLRLCKKGRLRLVRRGFYVIVPLEYRSSGILPPLLFIHELMNFIGKPYYVALLSAASLHGAAHEQPQELQVVTKSSERTISPERMRIRFFMKSHMENTALMQVKVDTGYIWVSSPEDTALDLVRYSKQVGGLSRVATVLMELSEKLTPDSIFQTAKREKELACSQRFGYILEKIGKKNLARKLKRWMIHRKPQLILLDPKKEFMQAPRNRYWNVVVNEEIESEV